MDSKTKKILLTSGVVAAAGIGIVALINSKVTSVAEAVLNLTVGANGHTSPEAGIHSYPVGTSMILVATPDTGYKVLGWTVDGGTQGTKLAIPVTLSEARTYEVEIEFTPGSQPPDDDPPIIVYSIENKTAPYGSSVNIMQRYTGYFSRALNGNYIWHANAVKDSYDNDWFGPKGYQYETIEFLAKDFNGDPISDADLEVYVTGTDAIAGSIWVNGIPGRTAQRPYHVRTHADGIARVNVYYLSTDLAALSRKHFYRWWSCAPNNWNIDKLEHLKEYGTWLFGCSTHSDAMGVAEDTAIMAPGTYSHDREKTYGFRHNIIARWIYDPAVLSVGGVVDCGLGFRAPSDGRLPPVVNLVIITNKPDQTEPSATEAVEIGTIQTCSAWDVDEAGNPTNFDHWEINGITAGKGTYENLYFPVLGIWRGRWNINVEMRYHESVNAVFL